MRIRALLIGAAIAVVPASAAGAQSFMDLPGMDAASDALPEENAGGGGDAQASGAADAPAAGGGSVGLAQTEPEDPLDLPGSGLLPVGGDTSAQPDGGGRDAAPAAAASGDELPRSGSHVAALALVGLALVSSGRLLREFVPRGD